MKKRILIASLTAAASCASALVNLGEGRIDLMVTSSLYHDSNIAATSDSISDTVFNLTPSLTYRRPSRQFDLSASVGVRLDHYFDNSDFSDENLFFNASLNPEAEAGNSRFTLSGDLIMQSQTAANSDVGGIITTSTYGLSGQLLYDPNERFDVFLRGSASREDPDSPSLNQIDRYEAGLTVRVLLKETLNADVGTSFKAIRPDSDLNQDSDIIALFAGFSGTLLPKLDGSVTAGYQNRSIDGGNDSSSPYVAASLDWRQSQTTVFSLQASNLYDSTINNYNTETLSVSLTGRRELNRQWSASATAGYTETSYDGAGVSLFGDRDDEEFYGQLEVKRQLTEWGSIAANVYYSDRSSSIPLFSYDRMRAGLAFTGTW